VSIVAYVSSVGAIEAPVMSAEGLTRELVDATPVRCPDPDTAQKMISAIEEARDAKNSLGGTVLGTLMADVTDIDELNTGSRREGMFGAVMAWMGKAIGTIQALAAGALLVATGFNPQTSFQTPETILGMRVLFSFVPAAVVGLAMLLLYRYPLTRERMAEIKELIEQRKLAAKATASAEE
jgi:Na+/melibiose symporter-like transporter